MTIPDDTPPGKGGKKTFYTDPDRKPAVLPVHPDGIPVALKDARRWVLWKLVLRDGKWTKVPMQVSGRNAKPNDPKTWGAFADVLAAYRRGGCDGIGFMLGDGFAGFDLDDIRNPVTCELVPWAAALISAAGTYTDVSPSGYGLKLFGRGVWRGDWHKGPHPSGVGEVEVYDGGRFFTVTGHHAGTVGEVADIQPALDSLAALFDPKTPDDVPPPPTPPSGGGCALPDDDELFARIRASKQGPKFTRLWAGDTSGHGKDDSAADLALCGILAFWCGPDADRIDRLFRRSGLMRAKWDSPRGDSTYGRNTVAEALTGKTEFYTPPGPRATFTTGTAPTPPAPPPWPDPPAEEAFYGLFGRIVRALMPHTEADPVALLVQLLVLFGSVVGRGPYFVVEATRHFTNEFAVLVGNTSRARKGTSKDRVASQFVGLDDDWLAERVCGGLSSAEGLIHAVRDPLDDDPGETDKRLCATERSGRRYSSRRSATGTPSPNCCGTCGTGRTSSATRRSTPARRPGRTSQSSLTPPMPTSPAT